MALVHAAKLTKSFGEKTVFSDVTFDVFPKERIGLVGVNGCGKTTLMRILSGEEPYDSGQVSITKGARVAVLDQSPVWPEGMTLFEAGLTAFSDLIAMETEQQTLNTQMADGREITESMLKRQDQLREDYERRGGLTFRSRTRSALLGLGFSENELSQGMASMSGGQMRKAELARVLLSDAELLLLDEPTNHLDIRSLEWLEDFLGSFSGAFIVISHDRYFMDHVCGKIMELENGTMQVMNGNYTAYTEKKLSEREFAIRHYRNGLREIKRIEGIIEQQRRWNQQRNYVTIASKQKQIERLKAALIKPEEAPHALHFRLHAEDLTCNEIIICKHLKKNFGEKVLFSDLNLLIQNGQRVCLIGENGCGKTTLMKILLGREEPTDGGYKLGSNVNVGYFSQSTVHTESTYTVLEEMMNAFPMYTQTELRNVLGTFLFHGDDVFKRLNALSGGELARIQLLKLMMSGSNVLFLDEPTNHLDIPSCEALENALFEYGGTMLIVTHDRYLANRVADRIVMMDKNGLTEFEGDWDSYKAALSEREEDASTEKVPSEKNDYLKNKERRAAMAKAKSDLGKVEKQIALLETTVQEKNKALQSPECAANYEAAGALYGEINALQTQLDEAYALWEQLEHTYSQYEQEDA